MQSRTKIESPGRVHPIGRMPLSTLISQALVAFTIKFNKESERRMQHRDDETRLVHGAARGGFPDGS